MSWGFAAMGDTGGLIIDSDYFGYFVDVATPTNSGPGNETWPLAGLNSNDILFGRPAAATIGDTAIAAFYVAPAIRDFWVPPDTYYYALKCYNGHTLPPSSGYGLEVYNELGDRVYSSSADVVNMTIVAQGTIDLGTTGGTQLLMSGGTTVSSVYCMINSSMYGLTFPLQPNQGFYYVYDFAANTITAKWNGDAAVIAEKFHYMLATFT
jgi:hypothetical protein